MNKKEYSYPEMKVKLLKVRTRLMADSDEGGSKGTVPGFTWAKQTGAFLDEEEDFDE
jgi:hypothetical protein